MSDYTSFLFARPSFLEGIARIMDLGGTLNEYNYSIDEEQADQLAVLADWRAVEEDLIAAINRFKARRKSDAKE